MSLFLDEHDDAIIETVLSNFKTNQVYNYEIVFPNAKCNLL